MHPNNEEFLNLLLWSADRLMHPTFRNLTESYEGWAYRNGLLRRIAWLERQRMIERDPASPDDRLYRLTWQGRLHALGGRDPLARWSRGMGRPVAPCLVRCSHKAEQLSQTPSTFPSEQRLRIPA